MEREDMGEDSESLEECPPEQPRHAEWKSWYRHKALGSLMAKKEYFFESIDKSLNDLNDPDRQEAAAVALFWSVYLADGEPMRLAGDKVREIDEWLDQEMSKVSKEEERRLAFVKLHLAGTLAISLIRPGVKLAEVPLAVKALERAVEMGPRVANCRRFLWPVSRS
jgi:hypothetical protein